MSSDRCKMGNVRGHPTQVTRVRVVFCVSQILLNTCSTLTGLSDQRAGGPQVQTSRFFNTEEVPTEALVSLSLQTRVVTLLWTPMETQGNCTEAPVGQTDPKSACARDSTALVSLTYSTSGSAARVSSSGGPWATEVWLSRSKFLKQVRCSWVDLLTHI